MSQIPSQIPAQIPAQISAQISAQIPTVTVSDVANGAIILDVRESDEWAAGHAPGAIHIPLGELPARLAELSDAGADVGAGTVAVTCRGGGRSSRAVAWLTEQGYHVANLDGGMKAWQAAGKPMVADGDVAPEVR